MSAGEPAEPAVTPPAAAPTSEKKRARSGGKPAADHDPLRGSRTSGIWITVLVLALLLLLLAVFILQNTQQVEVSYFGWHGRAPLAATVLIAAAVGALVVATAGVLRILQLRRRIKRERKA